MKFKLTAQEKKWILYDVGNSAFVLLVLVLDLILVLLLQKNQEMQHKLLFKLMEQFKLEQ